jgi:hypothetical protein
MFAAGAIAAMAIVVTAGYGYAAITATDQSYTGCLQSGNITSVAKGSDPLKPCSNNAVQISWNQTGPPGEPGTNGVDGTNGTNGTDGTNGANGTNGVSVTSATEPAGANCTYGGSKFTAADNNVTYACNGAPGTGGTGSGGPVGYAYVDHGVLDQSRTVGVNSMTLVPGSSDVYCFDVAGTTSNVMANRALGSGNSGGTTPTVAGTSAMPGSCPSGSDAAVVSGTGGTSSFFVLFN